MSCVDEKPAADPRAHDPARPMRSGWYTNLDQTYRLNGTVAVLAGLDVSTGRVNLRLKRRPRHQGFLALLQAARRRWAQGLLIVAVDNLPIHSHPKVDE